MKKANCYVLAILVIAALFLTGCGGGAEDSPTTTQTISTPRAIDFASESTYSQPLSGLYGTVSLLSLEEGYGFVSDPFNEVGDNVYLWPDLSMGQIGTVYPIPGILTRENNSVTTSGSRVYFASWAGEIRYIDTKDFTGDHQLYFNPGEMSRVRDIAAGDGLVFAIYETSRDSGADTLRVRVIDEYNCSVVDDWLLSELESDDEPWLSTAAIWDSENQQLWMTDFSAQIWRYTRRGDRIGNRIDLPPFPLFTTGWAHQMAILPGEVLVVPQSANSQILFYDLRTGELLHTEPLGCSQIAIATFGGVQHLGVFTWYELKWYPRQ